MSRTSSPPLPLSKVLEQLCFGGVGLDRVPVRKEEANTFLNPRLVLVPQDNEAGGRRRGRARGSSRVGGAGGGGGAGGAASAGGTGDNTPVENGTPSEWKKNSFLKKSMRGNMFLLLSIPGHGHANGGTESSCDSRDVSRASSIDREESNSNSAWPPPQQHQQQAGGSNSTSANSNSNNPSVVLNRDPDDYSVAVSSPPEPLSRRKPSRRAGSLLTNKRLKQSIKVCQGICLLIM